MEVKAESFKVLSVETRIKIIELLKAGPLSVNTIAEALGISQSAVSQHLRILKNAGLVADERRGYHIYYSLNKDKLDKYQQELIKVCTCGCELGRRKQTLETKKALLEYKKRLEEEIKQVEKRIGDLEKEN
jgi:DNA-binding transcriptional ArsR family regulator